ncbi:Hpt domain-containing protein [Spirosoma sp. SC4-14]|uniref:Hpt domain-containing protein n=1 Tax=Spirosoma sp. SC4-14 TaxID=3128900 RepID=UPI0030CF8D63
MEASDKNLVAVIDYERLVSLYGDNPRLIRNTFGLFLDSVLPDFEKLDRDVYLQQWPEIANAMHQVLPWLGMVGLTQLETDFRNLEDMVKGNPQSEPFLTAWGQFKSGFDLGVVKIRDELARMNDLA